MAIFTVKCHLVCCLLLCAFCSAHARVIETPDSIFAGHLATAADIYSRQYGHPPTSWQDIQLCLDVENGYRHLQPMRRYAFLARPIPLRAPCEGTLMVVTRRPFRDSLLPTPGRYIVFRQPNGFFRSAPVPENDVRQTFLGYENLLPAPDTEPERSWVRAARWRSVLHGSYLVLGVAGFAGLWWRWRRHHPSPPARIT